MCLAVLDLLRNSVLSIYQYVLNKKSRKLDSNKTSIESADTVCASLSFNSKQESVI